MRQRRWLLIGLAALVATALAAFNFLAYRHAYAMKHFTAGTVRTGEPQTLTAGQKLKVVFSGVNIPRPRSNLLPSKLGPDCRSITLSGTNGIALGAWYCAASAPSPLVILFHGYAGEKTGTLPEAKAFLDMGASVLLVDFRGSGDSSASYTTLGYEEAEDVATAVRYARDHFDHPQVILYGQSMGAAAVLRAVHIGGVQPDALIVEAVFDRMLNAVRHRFEARGFRPFRALNCLSFGAGASSGSTASVTIRLIMPGASNARSCSCMGLLIRKHTSRKRGGCLMRCRGRSSFESSQAFVTSLLWLDIPSNGATQSGNS